MMAKAWWLEPEYRRVSAVAGLRSSWPASQRLTERVVDRENRTASGSVTGAWVARVPVTVR